MQPGSFVSGCRMALLRWIRCRGRSYAGPKGTPERIMGAFLDITERKRIEEALNEQLVFESLMAELLATFVNVDATQVDAKIEVAQKLICQALGLDRSTLAKVSPKGDDFIVTHYWVAERLDRTSVLNAQDLPWVVRTILAGKIVSFERIDNLPEDAAKDKETFRRIEKKSAVMLPLYAGGQVIGTLAFGSLRRELTWPARLLDRLRLMAEVFANALARKQVSEELQTAYAELRQQKEILQTIFDHIPVMIGFGNGTFGLQLVNQAWEQTLGWTLDELHGDKLDFMRRKYLSGS